MPYKVCLLQACTATAASVHHLHPAYEQGNPYVSESNVPQHRILQHDVLAKVEYCLLNLFESDHDRRAEHLCKRHVMSQKFPEAGTPSKLSRVAGGNMMLPCNKDMIIRAPRNRQIGAQEDYLAAHGVSRSRLVWLVWICCPPKGPSMSCILVCVIHNMCNGVARNSQQPQPAQGLVHSHPIIEVEDMPDGRGSQEGDGVAGYGDEDEGKYQLACLAKPLGNGQAPGIKISALSPELCVGVPRGVHEEAPEEAADYGSCQQDPSPDPARVGPCAVGAETHLQWLSCSSGQYFSKPFDVLLSPRNLANQFSMNRLQRQEMSGR